MDKIAVSVGVAAHNEEKNIRALLESLLMQKSQVCFIKEIIVVSSGSTDGTDEIVGKFTGSTVRLIKQDGREGKASAVNLLIKESVCDILVLSSADLIIEQNAVDELVKPFTDKRVGMTGAHPVPIDSEDNVFGFITNLSWHLHHMGNLKNTNKPKLGEMVAFRKIFDGIFSKTAVDEADIQALFEKKGYKEVYCPNAVVRNKGPSHLMDYFRQRLRINVGHMELSKRTGYHIPGPRFFDKTLWGLRFSGLSPKKRIWAFTGFILENCIKVIAWFQLNVLKKNPYIWDISDSTKFNI